MQKNKNENAKTLESTNLLICGGDIFLNIESLGNI